MARRALMPDQRRRNALTYDTPFEIPNGRAPEIVRHTARKLRTLDCICPRCANTLDALSVSTEDPHAIRRRRYPLADKQCGKLPQCVRRPFSPFPALGSAALESHVEALKIDLRPSERQDFARHSPPSAVRERDGGSEGHRKIAKRRVEVRTHEISGACIVHHYAPHRWYRGARAHFDSQRDSATQHRKLSFDRRC